MKILVLGGAGYIGSVLTNYLIGKSYDVTVIDNNFYNQNSLDHLFFFKNFDYIDLDITEKKELSKVIKNFDVVIQLAAIVGAPACNKNPKLSNMINLRANYDLFEIINKETLLIFPNTNSGYGVSNNDGYCNEDSPLNPISTYAKDKVEIEKLFLKRENSISFRLATVFGTSPRMRLDLLVNDFVYKAFKDRSIVLFEENFRRNFIHVYDVALAFDFAITNRKKMLGQIFNLGLSSANLTKLQLCTKIKKFLPNFEIYTSQNGKDPDKRDYLVSNDKIERLGWMPSCSLDQGINELIKFYKYFKPNNNTNL